VTQSEPTSLDQDMTRTDLLWILQHLDFADRNGSAVLMIDRGVRDYLIRAIKPPPDRSRP
jgi:hypothetical protein